MAGGSFELYLIRHASAEERGEKWPDDNKRPLTEEGIARMRKAARGLARVGVTLDAVLTSPLVRARQTAEIVAAASDSKPPLVNVESLTPDGGYAAIVAELEKHARKAVRIALVGHEPLMGEHVAHERGELGVAREAQRDELTVTELVAAVAQLRRQTLREALPHLEADDAILHRQRLDARKEAERKQRDRDDERPREMPRRHE